jgi:hypothetical protein
VVITNVRDGPLFDEKGLVSFRALAVCTVLAVLYLVTEILQSLSCVFWGTAKCWSLEFYVGDVMLLEVWYFL